MGVVCPAILAYEAHEYRAQLERVEGFAKRLHIDLMDGSLTDTTSVGLERIYWSNAVEADLHVMYRRPFDRLDACLARRPRLVIVHAEAEGDFVAAAARLHAQGIKIGVALEPNTPVATIAPALDSIDHVLIFSGHLGHFGGQTDLSLLTKVTELRRLKRRLEIGWDGGVNDRNAAQLIAGGIDVLNVGGFIQRADDPAAAYATLKTLA